MKKVVDLIVQVWCIVFAMIAGCYLQEYFFTLNQMWCVFIVISVLMLGIGIGMAASISKKGNKKEDKKEKSL